MRASNTNKALLLLVTTLLLPSTTSAFYEDTFTNPQHLESCSEGWDELSMNDDDTDWIDPSYLNGGLGLLFYGAFYDLIWISSNGNVQFDTNDDEYQNEDLDSTELSIAAPLWDDWNPGFDGVIRVCKKTNRVVVEWNDVPQYEYDGTATFQAALYANGDIEFNYGEISNTDLAADNDDCSDRSDVGTYEDCGVTVGLSDEGDEPIDVEDPEDAEANDYNFRDSTYICYDDCPDEDAIPVPEFTTIGSAIALLGAAGAIIIKRRK